MPNRGKYLKNRKRDTFNPFNKKPNAYNYSVLVNEGHFTKTSDHYWECTILDTSFRNGVVSIVS